MVQRNKCFAPDVTSMHLKLAICKILIGLSRFIFSCNLYEVMAKILYGPNEKVDVQVLEEFRFFMKSEIVEYSFFFIYLLTLRDSLA